MRVRINALPKANFKEGGYANTGATRGYGMQQDGNSFALNRFWSSPAGYPGATSQVQPFARIGTVLPEAKDGGDINAEKNERVLGDFDQDGEMELMNVGGPSHAEGGKDVDVPSNSFVFSDTKDLKIKDPKILAMFGITTMKRGGFTPADIAKKYDLNKYKKVTSDPNADEYALKTAQLMSDNYLAKLSKLAQIQENMKKHMGMEHSADGVAKHGGMYQKGGAYDSSEDANGQANEIVAQTVPTPYGMYPGVTSDSPASGPSINLPSAPAFSGNRFQGYDPATAASIIKKYGKGHDNIPYSDEIAAGQGYDFRYGHNTEGLQRWIKEIDPSYQVGNNLYGIRTLSPSQPYRNVNPWDNPHEVPAMPGIPANTFPAGPTGPYMEQQGDNSNTMASGDTAAGNSKIKGKKDFNIGMDPNFYGNLQNLLGIASLRKFVPYEPVPQAVIPDTVFLDPTRAIAAQQEEARSGSEMDAMSGNSQAARAIGLARQGIAGKQAADTIGQYHNQNVQIANPANQGAAAITNQLMEKQANRLTELNKANFLSDREYQKQMSTLQKEYILRQQQQHNAEINRQAYNKANPYFYRDRAGYQHLKPNATEAKLQEMFMSRGTSGGNDFAQKSGLAKQYRDQLIKDGFSVAEAEKIAAGNAGLREHETQSYKPGSYSPSIRRSGIASGNGYNPYAAAYPDANYPMTSPETDTPYKLGGPLLNMGGKVDLYNNTKLKKFMK